MKISRLLVILFMFTPALSLAETTSFNLEELEQAENEPLYKKYELVCSVCSAIEDKKGLEAALKTDMKYATKYGVVNYTRRDRAVVQIRRDDKTIAEGKRKYIKTYSKKFNQKDCALVNTEDCESALMELSAKILNKIPWDSTDQYPK